MPTANQDNAAILALHEAGKTQQEIAHIIGNIDRSTISRRLKHLTPRKSTEIFKSQRADILAEMQRKILGSCTPADLKKMQPAQKITAAAILYDKERIERTGSDGASKPMIMVQINAPGGAEVKAVTVDKPVDNSPLLTDQGKDYGS